MNVTDEGLRHLTGLHSLESSCWVTTIERRRGIERIEPPTSTITDAGLVHLRDLPRS